MSILKDFRDELGDDPEPFVQRLLRTGVRPTELAEAVQEYLREHQDVTDDGVLAPNVLRITLGTKDHERLSRYGIVLPRALGTVVVETAAEAGWLLLGPVKVRIDRDELIKAGTYRLVGRVEAVEGWGPAIDSAGDPAGEPAGQEPATTGHAGATPTGTGDATDGADAATDSGTHGTTADVGGTTETMLVARTGVDAGASLVLDGRRVTAGRGAGCDLVVRDTTVSREHAAFVLRGDVWWVLDLGSTNGTRVNGLRAAEHPVTPGDRIELGDVVVELVEA
jgi:hypothetical protein